MEKTLHQPIAPGFEGCAEVGARIAATHVELARIWLERCNAASQPSGEPPETNALGKISQLVLQLGVFLRDPETPVQEPGAGLPAIAKEIAELKLQQAIPLVQVVSEYEALRTLLDDFAVETARGLQPPPPPQALDGLVRQLDGAILVLIRAAAHIYSIGAEIHTAREIERSTKYTRWLLHEVRNPLQTMGLALDLLKRESVLQDVAERNETLAILNTNLDRITALLATFEQTTRKDSPASPPA